MSKKRRLLNLSEEEKECLDTLFGKHFKYTTFTTPTHQEGDFSETDLKQTMSDPCVQDYITFEDDGPLNWQDVKLMTLKREMNDLKGRLSNKDIEVWHMHTTSCNLAGRILPYVKTLHIELCTQAWAKFYEILSEFKIVPNTDFLSVHLCEAPGAFISALNHHLQQQAFEHRWEWRATTLNPYCEANSPDQMISDDRLFRHTYSRCYFGPDGSGDIRSKDHITGLHSLISDLKCKADRKTLLVTADGSRDCQENPSEQERLLSQLHYCEMISACLILDHGGNFVLKVFTMFESSSVSLMFLLNIMFDEVHAFKPATSKGGNSETYLVCKCYRQNITDEMLWKMLAAVLDTNITCFIQQLQIPPRFMEEHQVCCEKFAQWQEETIQRNLDLSELCQKDIDKRINAIQETALDMFIDKTSVTYSRHFSRLANNIRVKSPFKIVSTDILESSGQHHGGGAGHVSQHKIGLKGTFQIRQNLNSMCFKDRLKLMSRKDCTKPHSFLICQNPLQIVEVTDALALETAKCFHVIRNSHLCDGELLNDLNLMFMHPECLNPGGHHDPDYLKSLALSLMAISDSITSDRPSSGQLSYIPHFLEHSPAQVVDVEKSTFRPQWDKTKTAWSCSLAGSPAKSSPSAGDADISYSTHTKDKVLYWLIEGREEDDKDSAAILTVFKELVTPDYFQISVINRNAETDQIKQFKCGSLVFMSITSSCSSASQFGQDASDYKEILTKKTCLKKVLWALQHICLGCSLVILANTFLTRFSAGLVYILARSFRKTSIESHPNLCLQQVLILEEFKGIHPQVVLHLAKVDAALEEEESDANNENTIVELVNFRHILNDTKFIQFLKMHNNFLMASFINIILNNHDKQEEGNPERDVAEDWSIVMT